MSIKSHHTFILAQWVSMASNYSHICSLLFLFAFIKRKTHFYLSYYSKLAWVPNKTKALECNRSFKQVVAQLYKFTEPPTYYSLGNKTDNILSYQAKTAHVQLKFFCLLFKISASQVDLQCCNLQLFREMKSFTSSLACSLRDRAENNWGDR